MRISVIRPRRPGSPSATASRALRASLLAAVLVAGTAVPATAASPYQRGPNPTQASISAARGAFSTAQTSISRVSARGYGGGTIYYPTTTTAGKFGAVVISPGFTAFQSSIAWLGPRIASQGFVVFTIDTLTTLDQPASRGRQLLAAADYLTRSSAVRGRIDAGRVAVMGHSMGGGGALEAAVTRPSLAAAIPLTGWNLDKTWNTVRVPTLVVGAERDVIAPVLTHSERFYTSLPASLSKAYLEIDRGTHTAPTSPNTTIAATSIAWLKRFVDDDTRYTRFLCPGPARSAGSVEEYRSTCPF